MKQNQKFESIIDQVKRDIEIYSLHMTVAEYVRASIEANEYFFFNTESDEELNQLNKDLVDYITD